MRRGILLLAMLVVGCAPGIGVLRQAEPMIIKTYSMEYRMLARCIADHIDARSNVLGDVHADLQIFDDIQTAEIVYMITTGLRTTPLGFGRVKALSGTESELTITKQSKKFGGRIVGFAEECESATLQ